MKGGMRVALGVAVGYFLGRTRKMKVALMLAGAGATGRLPNNSRELVREGIKRLGDSAEVGKLTESVRGELTDAAKRAVVAAASNRIDALTSRIEGVGSGVGEGAGKVGEDVGETVSKVGEGLLGEEEAHGDEEPEQEQEDRTKQRESGDAAEGDGQDRGKEGAEPRRPSSASRSSSSRRSTPRTRKDAESKSRTRSRTTTSTEAPVRRTGR